MIPLANHHLWWGRSEVVLIYPDIWVAEKSIRNGYGKRGWSPNACEGFHTHSSVWVSGNWGTPTYHPSLDRDFHGFSMTWAIHKWGIPMTKLPSPLPTTRIFRLFGRFFICDRPEDHSGYSKVNNSEWCPQSVISMIQNEWWWKHPNEGKCDGNHEPIIHNHSSTTHMVTSCYESRRNRYLPEFLRRQFCSSQEEATALICLAASRFDQKFWCLKLVGRCWKHRKQTFFCPLVMTNSLWMKMTSYTILIYLNSEFFHS